MEIFLVFVGIILALLALFTFFSSFDLGLGVFCLSLFMGALAVLCFVGANNISSHESQSDPMNVDENLAAVDIPDDNSSEVNATDDNSSSSDDDSNSSGAFDPKNPDKWPGDKATKVEKHKWWQHWAEEQFDDSMIICREGIQYHVNGVVDGNGDTDSMTIWPRIHPDGRPFSCSESQDPSKEVSL
jgi:hypothetical protein